LLRLAAVGRLSRGLRWRLASRLILRDRRKRDAVQEYAYCNRGGSGQPTSVPVLQLSVLVTIKHGEPTKDPVL